MMTDIPIADMDLSLFNKSSTFFSMSVIATFVTTFIVTFLSVLENSKENMKPPALNN